MNIKRTIKRIFLGLLVVIGIIAALISIEILGGQPMGLFSGSRPDGLGFNNGQFKLPSWKPNTVSSTVEKSDATHYIAPISFSGDAGSAWKKFVGVVNSQSRATVVTDSGKYLYAEFKTPSMGFVDDVEAALDAKANVIHVRSASRLGVRDFDANRKRIEALREKFGAAFAK